MPPEVSNVTVETFNVVHYYDMCLGEFHMASDYLRFSCTSVGARYGLHSIEYGSECHKLAGVLLHRLVKGLHSY